tara:strand:+ start:31585 stop:32835 length:1251 start_codon:yes stop_codon:yes gene_type:complete
VNYPKSAYIHIPFCHRRCSYCDFAIVPIGDESNDLKNISIDSNELIENYLGYLYKEISLTKETFPLSTIYIGGGTPSILSSNQIGSLIELISSKFGIQEGAEITLEADPASFSLIDLEGYLNVGVNRISLGAQSFDNQVLLEIGRKHNRTQIIECCNWLKELEAKCKLRSWTIDLIQNLPNQTSEDWANNLGDAILQRPPHISVYDLQIENGTIFYGLRQKGLLNLPSEKESSKISLFTSSFLKRNGYYRYEISNYTLPGHISRHNRVYWSGEGWWGFGQSATSCPWGKRFTRPKSILGYKKWVLNQELNGPEHSLKSENKSLIDLDEQILVGLRRREGINLYALFKNWGWNKNDLDQNMSSLMKEWSQFIASGKLLKQGDRYYLKEPQGMEISNQILINMYRWWESKHGNPIDPN